jgi:hypothetical protein
MSEQVVPNLDTVKFTRLCEVLKKVEKEYQGDINELEISFEFLIGTFYPHVLKNIQSALAREHTLGFIEGRESLNED